MTKSFNLRSLSFALAIAFAGCAADKNTFSSNPKTPAVSDDAKAVEPKPVEPVIELPVALEEKEESFEIEKIKSKVDVIWTIDNSSSMSQEAANVRDNFAQFIASLKGTDLHVGLLSTPTGAYGVSLPISDSTRYLQAPQTVASSNLLAMVSAALCDAAKTTVSPAKICGIPVSSLSNANTSAGKLLKFSNGQNFIRPDSTLVFVFVTDDQASIFMDTHFQQFLAENFPKQKAVVYGFVGTDAATTTTCSVARQGTAYMNLAKATGGESLSICSTNWKQHFDDLVQGILKVATSRFALAEATISSIVKVEVDGVEISKDLYSLNGSQIEFKNNALKTEQRSVKVVYKYVKN